MKAAELQELSAALGLRKYGGNNCAVVDNWPINILNANYADHILVTVDSKMDKDIKKQLNAELKAQGGKVTGWVDYNLSIGIPSAKKLSMSHSAYVRFVLSKLKSVGLKPNNTCPYCGKPDCDVSAFTNKGYRLAHRGCMQGHAADTADKAERNKQSGSYVAGILGAILGMIVGTIPSLLTIIFAERVWAVLFALMPICAYYGYKLLGGKMNKVALVTSIVMAILGVIVMQVELATYMLVTEYNAGVGEALGFVLSSLSDGAVWSAILSDSLTDFLFAALGVWFAWSKISVTAGGTADVAAAVLESAEPYPPVDNSQF